MNHERGSSPSSPSPSKSLGQNILKEEASESDICPIPYSITVGTKSFDVHELPHVVYIQPGTEVMRAACLFSGNKYYKIREYT